MMNLKRKVKINNFTYLFLFLCFLCGYIKNICIIFFICIVHEFGHVIFIKLFKYEITSIELFPFGGFTTINKRINTSINKDIIISIAGIFNQMILLVFLLFFKKYMNNITYNLFIQYNLTIMIFNMLPIIPLDGNNIIHLLLEKFFSYKLSNKINILLSIIFFILFIIVNYIYNFDNLIIIIFLLYKLIIYIRNVKYLDNRFILERYLYDFNYNKIINNSVYVDDLRRDVYHYFKVGDKYISEKNMIKYYFDNQ